MARQGIGEGGREMWVSSSESSVRLRGTAARLELVNRGCVLPISRVVAWGGRSFYLACSIDFIYCIDSRDLESVVIVGEGHWAVARVQESAGGFLVNRMRVFQFRG